LQTRSFEETPRRKDELVESEINSQQLLLENVVEPRWQQGLTNQDQLMKLLPWLKENDEGYL